MAVSSRELLQKNSLLLVALSFDTEKAFRGWKGGQYYVEFLQFNGGPTNTDAGAIQGYNSLPGSPPLDRSELYQAWYRQELFDKKLIFRIGKIQPAFDFNNVVRSVPTADPTLATSVTTGLIYTPIFVNSSMLGMLPSYYNSAFGITLTFAPIKSFYCSLGMYDGNMARGKQTGLRGPQFNGYYFQMHGLLQLGYLLCFSFLTD